MISISSLTATSVSVSWDQPAFSFTPIDYTVSLTRVTGEDQALCSDLEDNRPELTTDVTAFNFTSLKEFSTYTVTIVAQFLEFNTVASALSASENFITLSAG